MYVAEVVVILKGGFGFLLAGSDEPLEYPISFHSSQLNWF